MVYVIGIDSSSECLSHVYQKRLSPSITGYFNWPIWYMEHIINARGVADNVSENRIEQELSSVCTFIFKRLIERFWFYFFFE